MERCSRGQWWNPKKAFSLFMDLQTDRVSITGPGKEQKKIEGHCARPKGGKTMVELSGELHKTQSLSNVLFSFLAPIFYQHLIV